MSETAIRLAQNFAQADFKISPPGGPSKAPQAPVSPQGPTPSPAPSSKAPIPMQGIGSEIGARLPKEISTSEIAIAAGIFILLLVVFFFAKMSVTRGLQSRYAAPGPASEAGWLLFTWLAFTALVVIAVTVAQVWMLLPVVIPAGVVSLILLILFVRKRSLALRTRR